MEDRWKELLNQAETFSAENLSASSKRTYASRMKVYEQVLIQLEKDPYPISIEKMKGFIVNQINKGRTYSTIVA